MNDRTTASLSESRNGLVEGLQASRFFSWRPLDRAASCSKRSGAMVSDGSCHCDWLSNDRRPDITLGGVRGD